MFAHKNQNAVLVTVRMSPSAHRIGSDAGRHDAFKVVSQPYPCSDSLIMPINLPRFGVFCDRVLELRIIRSTFLRAVDETLHTSGSDIPHMLCNIGL